MHKQALARVGSTLRGKWRLDELIGVGGMAAVYAATHRNGHRVAIKMLHPQLSFASSVQERFLREGYTANGIEHAGIARILDDDESEDGSPFLVMELLTGETLDTRWRRMAGRLPLAEVLAIGQALLDVLDAAHRKGILHRDIKPENVFLTADGQVKLLDFGIARVREVDPTAPSVTRTGATIGTPAFMAPEQARGRNREIDGRSDLWAVGATLFALLTGSFVHPGETPNEVLIKTATERAPSLRSLRWDLDERVIDVVDRALAFSPSDRWPDALSFRDALREIAGTRAPPCMDAPEGTPEPAQISLGLAAPPRSQRMLRVGAVASVVLAVAACVALLRPAPAPPSSTAALALDPPLPPPASAAPAVSSAPPSLAVEALPVASAPEPTSKVKQQARSGKREKHPRRP
ncbi:MAG: serine/threonine protein kinase [Polyangiaceae bacterium]|nr:serine/threonine protein kinase [Polyangiaceae bacterium]